MRSHASRYYASLAVLLGFAWVIPAQADVEVYYSEIGFADSVNKQQANPTVATGSHTTVLSLPSGGGTRDPRAIAVDNVNGKIYYADGASIGWMNLDGSSPATIIPLLPGGPGDIEVDPAGGRIYYSTLFNPSTNGIFSANLDGTGVTPIHTNASLLLGGAPATVTVNDVFNLSVDTSSGLLYWSADDGGVAGRIALNSSSTVGGAAAQHFIGASASVSINRMDIDFGAGDVYYTVGGGSADAVRRSTLAGTGVTTLVTGIGSGGAFALDLPNDEMFFFVGGRIHQYETDGTSISSKLILSGGGFAAADMQVVPEPSACVVAGVGVCFALISGRRQRRLRGR